MNTQPPRPGSPRFHRAMLVGQWLRRNTHAKRRRFSWGVIAASNGLTVQQTQHAVYDLRDHFPDEAFIISVPCAQNDWSIEVGWTRGTRLGLMSQLRQNATREVSLATVLERAADQLTTKNPSLSFTYRRQARHARQEAYEKRELAELIGHEKGV